MSNLSVLNNQLVEVAETAKETISACKKLQSKTGINKYKSTIEFIEKGADGIVCLMPFTCLHGNIYSAILKKIREDYNNLPCLILPFESLETTNIQTRLEAFVYQVKEYKKMNKK